MSKCKEFYTPREVIENQVLAALDDKSKVAIILDKEDVDLLIAALDAYPCERSGGRKSPEQYAADLRQLRLAAFKE